VVLSHPHDEVEACHKGANGTQKTSEYGVVETNTVVGGIKGDCEKINMGIIGANRGLPSDSTQHSSSL